MPRKINIIGKADGAGLSRDLALLADALRSADHEVSIVTIDDPQARLRCSLLRRWVTRVCSWRERPTGATQVDLNLMLEHAWPQYLRTARTNVVIPNPEWFDRHDQHLLPCLDGVWAKTQHAQELFTALRCNTTLIGFDGVDRHHPGVPRNRTFFHLAGGSRNKGTEQLLRIWARNPYWPQLTVVQRHPEPDIQAHNILRLTGFLDDPALRVLQNSHLFHVCLSQTEGWGHSIVEAMSTGAVTLTVDAPPMNELVDSTRGLLVPCVVSGSQRLATLYEFDEDALQATIQRAMAMTSQQCQLLGMKARAWFLRNKQGFPDRLAAALHA